MKIVEKICLSCKFFRLQDPESGICRVDRDTDRDYPQKVKGDSCSRWLNCGQQYYIRLGWIKGKTGDSIKK